MEAKITFLGTGSSKPTARRNHPALLLEYGSENILFDCGEGTQRQFRIAKLNPCKLNRIFISHWHGDHTLGLPGLLQTMKMSEYSGTLEIYGPKETKKNLDKINEVYGHFYKEFGENMNIKVKEISSGVVLDEKEFKIEATLLNHGTPCYAYSFIIKDKRRIHKDKLKKLKLPHSPLLKKLQEGKDVTINGKKLKAKDLTYIQKGKKLTIIADTALTPNASKASKDADILVSESTYSSEEKETAKDRNHLTAEQAATIAKKAKAKKLILNHLSERYEYKQDIILKEAKKVFKETIIAKDFDKFSF